MKPASPSQRLDGLRLKSRSERMSFLTSQFRQDGFASAASSSAFNRKQMGHSSTRGMIPINLNDPNGSPNRATWLGANPRVTRTGNIGYWENGYQDKYDFYKFSLTRATVVTATLSGLFQNANLEITSGNYSQGYSANPGTATEQFTKFLYPGTYYALVYKPNSENTQTTYRLTLTT
jgi:hypothetical protein